MGTTTRDGPATEPTTEPTPEPTTRMTTGPSDRTEPRWPRAARLGVGGFYLVMGGINAGIVAADPQTYRTFADGSFRGVVTRQWHELVMPHPYVWFVLLAAGEVALGVLLLSGGRAARLGWSGVIAFQVLLMAFGYGFWLWSIPALLLLVPAAVADWPHLAGGGEARPAAASVPLPRAAPTTPPGTSATSPRSASVWTTIVLASLVVACASYGLLAATPYRDLPESTVAGARAQDAVSIVVAFLLVALVARPAPAASRQLLLLGLHGYLVYSYLIYVSGVPMNRAFLGYVAIVALSGAALVRGLVSVLRSPPASRATRRLRSVTGWMLAVTAVLFACLWLAALLPYALGGAAPSPEGVGGTPYPVFWLDLAIVLPAIGAIGISLLRDRAASPGLAVVALVKIVTLFTALWAGPVVAVVSGRPVELGPDAVPSLALLAGSVWLLARWMPTFAAPVIGKARPRADATRVGGAP